MAPEAHEKEQKVTNMAPEYRMMYIPQDVLLILWRRIFDMNPGAETTHNRAYLFDLTGHFREIGETRAQKLLQKLEKEYSSKMIEYKRLLWRLKEVLEEEFSLQKLPHFTLDILSTDDNNDVRKKLMKKEKEVQDALEKWCEAYHRLHEITSRMERNVNLAQVAYMTYIVLRQIAGDEEFIRSLIEKSQKWISSHVSEEIGVILGSAKTTPWISPPT